MGACGSWGLLVVVALATMHAADSAPVSVGSFSELNLAVSSGVRAIEIAAPSIMFDHQLLIESTALLIESTVGATFSSGNQTRLFFLQNGSKLSLRGVNLVGGVSGRCFNCMSHGGAVFVSGGSELRLYSARVFNNRANRKGGAIYAINSTVVAIDCTMSSNTASWGGAIYAIGSTVTTVGCTMIANAAHLDGGAVFAQVDSTVTATHCTMTLNSAVWGGAVSAGDDSTVTTTHVRCLQTLLLHGVAQSPQ